MRRLSLAFIAAVSTVALTQIAAAADLPRKAPAYTPPPPVPVFSWTGFYVGVNGGYGWHAGDSDVTAVNVEISEALTTTDQRTLNPKGWFGGGQIGYNWQFAPQWIAGIEADIQGANINGSATAFAPNPVLGDPNDPNANVNAYAKTKLDWFGTIRARLGYTLFDRTLIYATGGFAFGGVKDALSVTELSEGTLLSGAATHDKTATGYVLGGGLEYALSPAWSLKGEYQYMHLGNTTLGTRALEPAGTPDCCDAPSGSAKFEHNYNTFRIGLNYRFGAPY